MEQPRELRMAVYVGLGIYLYPALPQNERMKLIPKSSTFERAPFCQYIKRHMEMQSPCVIAVLTHDTYIFLRHFEMNNEWNNLRHLYVLLNVYFQYSLSSPGNTVSFFLWRCFPTRVMAFSFSRFLDHTHNDAPQSVGLLQSSDQLVEETSTWQHTTLTTDKHPCPRWNLSRRATADLRLRPRGHWDRQYGKLDKIYLLAAIEQPPGGSSTVHIYTQTIHRTTPLTNWEECGPCPVFASYTLAFALQLRKEHGKTSVSVAKASDRAAVSKCMTRTHPEQISYLSTNDTELHLQQAQCHKKIERRRFKTSEI